VSDITVSVTSTGITVSVASSSPGAIVVGQQGPAGPPVPAGTNTRVLFSDNEAVGTHSGFTFDKTTGQLTLPGLVEQYNGATAQGYRLYNNRIDAANYERGGVEWNGTALRVFTERAGTGSVRGIVINSAAGIQIGTSGTGRILIGADGHILPDSVDVAYDFGNATWRWRDFHIGRDIYLARKLTLGAGAYITGSATLGGTIFNSADDLLNVAKFNNDQTSSFWGHVSPSAFKNTQIDLGIGASARWRSAYFQGTVFANEAGDGTGGFDLFRASPGLYVLTRSATGVLLKSQGSITLGVATGQDFQVTAGKLWANSPFATNIELRDGANARSLTVFNTYTDAANSEYGVLRWTTNVFEVGADANGTGTLRQLRLRTRGGASILFAPGFGGGGDKWEMNSSGHLAALAAYNITTTGAVTTTNLSVAGNPVVGTGATNPKINFGSTGATALALRVTAVASDTLDVVRNDEGSYYKMRALTFDAIGGQIKFPAVQVASADANTLDDYREVAPGTTFVPTILFGGAAVGLTYSVQHARYTKIGNVVHFKITIQLTNKGSSVGAVTVGGMPFNAAAGTGYTTFSITGGSLTGVTAPLQAYIADNSGSITLAQGFGTLTTLQDTNIANNSLLMIAGEYFV
jgi:hypothetical protein